MFPEYEDIDVMPDEELEEGELAPTLGRAPLFDFSQGKYVVNDGKVVECSQQQAVKQWVAFLVKTAADKFDVYQNTEFGTNLHNYIGFKDTGFVASEIEREVSEKVTQNRAISGLTDFEVERKNDKLIINLVVTMKDESEVLVDVEV